MGSIPVGAPANEINNLLEKLATVAIGVGYRKAGN
jgi:hypothetical protein